jgi:hypothetical protein
MQRALEALVMERQFEGKTSFPPFAQQIFERGKLEEKRDALLRLLSRAGIVLSDEDLARIENCTDATTLDRWVDNVLGAKTALDVLS